MKQLPQEVHDEFMVGNFVVKWSDRPFAQVDADHALEWMNCVGKESGGIVGITKTSSALDRWALSFNLRSMMAAATLELSGMTPAAEYRHAEQTAARKAKDQAAERGITAKLQLHDVFPAEDIVLTTITSKEESIPEIQRDLIESRCIGESLANNFIQSRIIPRPANVKKHPFMEPMKKLKSLTFASLKQGKQQKQEKTSKIDIDCRLLQRIMGLYESGRPIDMDAIMKHELAVVPLSIALPDGTLRSGNKSQLINCLTGEIHCPSAIETSGDASMVIDAMGLVQALGRPVGALTFGDLADKFSSIALQSAIKHGCTRLDVIFDRYDEVYIKAGTRDRRRGRGDGDGRHEDEVQSPSKRQKLLRSAVLPSDWKRFLSESANKRRLAEFIGLQLIESSTDISVVVAGAFENAEDVRTNDLTLDVEGLMAYHEEADTRIILHASQMTSSTVVVQSRDTDVLVLMIAHRQEIRSANIWMKSGTASSPKFIPVHDVHAALPADVIAGLLPFHALTGSDTTSFFHRKGKKVAWMTFCKRPQLLRRLGKTSDPPGDELFSDVEEFVCALYGMTKDNVSAARSMLFQQGKPLRDIPPSADALGHHVRRAHYQAAIWLRAVEKRPELPPRDGWCVDGDRITPVLMSLPSNPECLTSIIRCHCKKGCGPRCTCAKSKLTCTVGCKCSCR